MTENEAIKELETSIDLAKMCTQNYERKREVEAYNMAIKALEEIQQYRAIGTVEEIKATIENLNKVLLEHKDKLAPYVNIGTVEEFKALKDKSEPKKLDKKTSDDIEFYHCPHCSRLRGTSIVSVLSKYCEDCGQAIDWSE